MNWYGTLPERWGAQRIKTLFTLRDERNFKPLSEVRLISLYTAIGVKPHDEIERIAGNVAVTAYNYKKVYVDDIVVNIILCWQGAIGLSKWDGVTSPAYDVYRAKSNNISVDYYNYLFRTPMFSGECYKAGRGIMAMRWRTYSDQFTAIDVPLPPRDEQDQIVRYLDWKVSQVNKLINTKRRQIALLGEQKRAVINSYLYSEKSIRLSICTTKIGSGKTPRGGAAIYVESGVLFIRSQNVYPFKMSSKGAYYITDAIDEEMKNTRVYRNDVLLNITGGSIGRCSVYRSDDRANVNQHVCIIRTNSDLLLPDFLELWLNSVFGQNAIKSCQNAGNRESLTFVQIASFAVPFYPVDKQAEITSRVQSLFEPIDRIEVKYEQEIALLHEYRTRLISDVVTGKLDVRGVVVPEYEAVEDIATGGDEADEDVETEG